MIFNCIINTYVERKKLNPAKAQPESNIACPLDELGLIEVTEQNGNRDRIFRKTTPKSGTIHPYILLAVIVDQAKGRREIKIDELQHAACNIGKAFNLDILTKESCVKLSEQVNEALRDRGFSDRSATQAALFTEEIGLTLIDKNKESRKPLLVEISLLLEESSVLLIERDSGAIYNVTDPELKIDGLSSFVINGLLNAQKEKAYLTTTGYNRNMIRFSK